MSSRDSERDAPPPFEQLDFIYMPSPDVAADVRYFTDVLGAQLVFAIDAMDTQVAMLRLTESPPRLLLADHVEGDQPILVYRVADLARTLDLLEGLGWQRERQIELPVGPASSFRAPGGQRIALYESTRPEVEEHVAGRRDF